MACVYIYMYMLYIQYAYVYIMCIYIYIHMCVHIFGEGLKKWVKWGEWDRSVNAPHSRDTHSILMAPL